MDPSLSHTSGDRTRNTTSTRHKALNPANLKPSRVAGKYRREEETQVILDTQLAAAALDFQLSSDPPPHPEQSFRNSLSPSWQRLIVSEMLKSNSRTNSRHVRTEPNSKSSWKITQSAPPSSSDYEANTSLFVAMMGTEVVKGGPPIRRAMPFAEDDSKLRFRSASADADYGANDSLFLATIEAEGHRGLISSKETRVQSSPSVEGLR
ncbi:hypothetical protein E6O75_ATG07382 [Venturia nashicola]|uniref:Uncharacterized protein n=1 Tax=Venturia nashicola TaxID=86259 RepID=A0A4Z1NYL8_9PEZI|nr:hypothetical protein E6O75_ATG07382 [Venturia nashicola]